MNRVSAGSVLTLCFVFASLSHGFQVQGPPKSQPPSAPDRILAKEGRRGFLGKIALLGSVLVINPSSPAGAEEDSDLLSKMYYNADGSLKDNVESEAKSRQVEFTWDSSEELLLSVDGVNTGSTQKGSKVKLSYNLPEKWGTGTGTDALYFDRSEGVNAKSLNRISVYQAPGAVQIEQLEKATKMGVGKALRVTDDMKDIRSADLIGGRTTSKDEGQKYFEFDLAVAPKSCDSSSKENLGLGFCPYESIYLMSATTLDDKLYVIALQCDKSEWKQASSDLKRVRSSFRVELA
jgi:hypothetical protein